MSQNQQEYPFQNLTFSPDQSVVTLTFVGLKQPVLLRRYAGRDQVTLRFSETLGNQRLAVANDAQTVFLNFPFMLALQDWLEPAPE